jgi:hypothetical protein
MKCDMMHCDHKVVIVCGVLKRSLVIEAYDETFGYRFVAYIDNELCDEGQSRLIYELAEKGEFEKILTLICDD